MGKRDEGKEEKRDKEKGKRNDDDTQDADSGRALVGLGKGSGGFTQLGAPHSAGKSDRAIGGKQANPGKCDWRIDGALLAAANLRLRQEGAKV